MRKGREISITEEQNQEHTRLAAVNKISKTIASSPDLRQVYDIFASQLRRLLAFDRAGVNLIEGDKVKVFASSADEKAEFASGVEIPLKGTAAEQMAANKKVHISTDLAKERKYWTDNILFQEGMGSVIRIPLFSRGEVIGTFSVASRQPNAFGKKEQQILEEVTPLLAVTIENARLFEQTRARAEELKASEEKYRQLFESTLDGMAVIDAETMRVMLANQAAAKMYGFDSVEDITGVNPRDVFPPGDRDRVLKIIAEDMFENDLRQINEFRTITKDGREIWISALGVRTEYQGKLAGLISFRDISERKRAEEESKSYTKRVEALYAVAQAVSQTLDMEKMLDSVLEKVMEAMEADAANIYLLDEEAGEVVLKAHRGVSEKFVSVMGRIKVTEADIQRWLEQREPAFGLERMLDASTLAEVEAPIKGEGMQSYVGTSLLSKDVLHGAMVLGGRSKRWFSLEELDLLRAIGNEIAVGIENAQLLEETRGLSITDELTGLYNRRHFYEVLETEMYRTERYGRPFSLAMLDLDGFKQYNDKFGHTNGDALLQAVAQTLKSSLRKTDTAFRYGGDEFTIILPATDTDRAEMIVDRIRSKWSEVPKPENLVLETPLGLSAGIAQFPENAETADGLVFLTDTALYCSKMEGGDKTTLVSDLGALTSDVLSRSTLEQVYALSATVDARDPFTYGHSKRVAAISEMIGKAIGLSRDKLANLHAASLLHDIGKVGVSDSILTKPGKPTKAEWKLIKKHSAEGARIVGYFKELAALVPTIRHHHEWYGGMGYPDGLKGEDIPLGARIISIADAYDTMTTPRTYRDVVSQQEACEELRRCSGTQFDPELVEAFCQATNEATRQD